MEKVEKLKNLEKELDKAFYKKKLLVEETYCQRPICTKTLRVFIEISGEDNFNVLTLKSKLIGDTFTAEKRIGDLLNSFYVVEEKNGSENRENEENKENIVNKKDSEDIEENKRSAENEENKEKVRNKEDDKDIENKGHIINKEDGDDIENIKDGVYKSENIFEWHTELDNPAIDGFTFSINKDVSFLNCYFEFKNSVNQYKISDKLQSIINRRVETKTKVIIEVWKYIMSNKLFDNHNRSIVHCDENMKRCFSVDFFMIYDLERLVSDHLLGFDPVLLRVPVVNGHKSVYDLKIDLDDLNEMPKLYSNPQINQLENKISEIEETMANIRERINNLDLYGKDPHGFLSDWVLKRYKDLMPVENIFHGDHMFFYDEDVQKSIFKLLRQYK